MAHLRIFTKNGKERRLPLLGEATIVGRTAKADLPVMHKSISRRHAMIRRSGATFTIEDLGSSNGTFVGGERLGPGRRKPLPVGTRFRLGVVEIDLVADEGGAPEKKSAPTPTFSSRRRGARRRRSPARGRRREGGAGAFPYAAVTASLVFGALALLVLLKILAKAH